MSRTEPERPGPGRPGPCALFALLVIAPILTACTGDPGPARSAIDRSIAVHGGEQFESIRIDFSFRQHDFTLIRDGGRFHQERRGPDADGRQLREVMDNDGTRAWIDGDPVPLEPSAQRAIETAVNSVVYFGFLPFRLDDPAVRSQDLGRIELEGREYRKVEVTFEEEGGGRDWEDRFVYWFDTDTGTLDYLSYRFHTGDGGTRFRRAINRRSVGGLLVQDYENYTADPAIDDVAEYDQWYRDGRLELVSEIRLENLRVSTP